VPLTVRLIVGLLLVLAGLLLAVVAVLGARSRLPRNRWVGVRTPATVASDAAFATAHRAAAAPTGAAAAVAVAGGAVLTGAGGAVGWVVLVVSVLGVLGLAGLAGLVGDRAAAGMASPVPFSAACAGSCAGCDLVAGCRPAALERAEEPASAE
jgi:hypothetical protein